MTVKEDIDMKIVPSEEHVKSFTTALTWKCTEENGIFQFKKENESRTPHANPIQ